MGKVITISNQKGGIGKTTTATNMAYLLNMYGYKTLLIDADGQCNSTDVFNAKTGDGVATILDLMLIDQPMEANEVIQHTESGDIIAGDQQMIHFAEARLSSLPGGDCILTNAIRECKDEYDFIVIDTNPTINKLLINSLAAADEIIIPIHANRFGEAALSQITNTIMQVQRNLNPTLIIDGLLIVAYKPNTILHRNIAREVERIAKDEIGTKVYTQKIRVGIAVEESQTERKLLEVYDSKSNPAMDYRAFVKEFLREHGLKVPDIKKKKKGVK